MNERTLSLPLISPEDSSAPAVWQGFTTSGPLDATAPPEPDAPQGEYSTVPSWAPAPAPAFDASRPVELLAPAGGPQSRRRRSPATARLRTRGPGTRTDVRGSPRHHRDRRH